MIRSKAGVQVQNKYSRMARRERPRCGLNHSLTTLALNGRAGIPLMTSRTYVR